MITSLSSAIYWDSSAVLSALFSDRHSEEAWAQARGPGVHLLSSLAWAEVHAVIARAERDQLLADVLVQAARESMRSGPWRFTNASPDWTTTRALSARWPLRGADLWHLATAKTLQADLPELRLVTFDTRLAVAAAGEGLR